MTDAPESHYTRSADGTNLAYQVSGDGPLDLVFLNTALPIDLLSEDAGFIRLRKRLDTFSRTVWFESRGVGASEGDARDTNPGGMFDADLIAVLDAAGFERAALLAEDAAGGRAIHFSVTHPERVSALVLVNSYAHYVRKDDYPWGLPPEIVDRYVVTIKETWGTAAAVEVIAPSRVADGRFRAWYSRSMRFTGGPDQIGDTAQASLEADLRPCLPAISCPTLVLHREGNRYIHLGLAGTWPSTSPTPRSWCFPGRTTCTSWVTPTPWWTRSRSS
jgi:pimeloyl-ACP methyl ester carboxylesterase